MPRKEINYSNTYFYRIVCKDLQVNECYVGHTTNFTKRKNTHKNNCNNTSHNTYLYRFMRENGGYHNFEMVLLETLDCNSRLEALRKERQYIEELNATLNQIRPHATDDDRTQQGLDYNEKNDKTEWITPINTKSETNKNTKTTKKLYVRKQRRDIMKRRMKSRNENKTTIIIVEDKRKTH